MSRPTRVSSPVRSTRTSSREETLSVPAWTRSPGSTPTGADSPESSETSTPERPATTTPSAGTTSPARTSTSAPGASASSGTSRTRPPSTSRAELG